jgi:hypothetical protein
MPSMNGQMALGTERVGELAGDGERLIAVALLELLALIAELERQTDFVRHLLLALEGGRQGAEMDNFVKAGGDCPRERLRTAASLGE